MIKKSAPKEIQTKPKYSVGQNVWFMIRLAWTSGEKKVLVLSFLSAVSFVALNLINLYISPRILAAVEAHVSLQELFWTILALVLAMMAVSAFSAYINTNTLYGRITVRVEIINLLNRKVATISYPNLFDDGFSKLLAKATECISSNRAATEAVWTTLTDLTKNGLGFLAYVLVLSAVQPVLILVILGTAVLSYFISNYVNGYGYRHRAEEAEYQKHMNYIAGRVRDFETAKDIRIFGLRPWLTELYNKALMAYTAFHRRTENVYIWARVADLVLTLLRNGIAYAYLIGMVLRGGISAVF